MKAIDTYREIINKTKAENILTDGVKLILVGMFIADSELTSDESKQLQREIDFDFDKYMGIEEAAIFGDIVDYKNQRINYTKEELMKKK